MAARVVAVLITALLLPAAAENGPSFSEQARSVHAMMEAARRQAEGKAAVAPAIGAHAATDAAPSESLLDTQLLRAADRVASDLHNMDSSNNARKSAVLTAERAESKRSRAARYFATHGMEDLGRRLLGVDANGKAWVDHHLPVKAAEPAPGTEEDYQKRWGAVDALRKRAAVQPAA
mmetsp:Transcript_78033/g.180956  ORF Transcript_78033/g.180956 Transcript_78033/m.180956 type:complete len:177 (+) Transcript_78033:58-588(+)|eukprot:CAMPEP_0171099754 /NCGR_PEP_ID=MMETSP0766_2-20121228/52504_1 /TAXON_ID=439317 /ORGANISM="Gambierdiscus australes, Strain CAWD 149" /LENGTH=176 /DNA_ID=CAMNT_0011559457 /DNA_START=56 /DNA_END=586 /DNA_ORIENTATION=+